MRDGLDLAVAVFAWRLRQSISGGKVDRWESQGARHMRALFLEACRRFVGGVRLVDPDAIAALHGTPLLLLANHQVAIESVLAGIVLPADYRRSSVDDRGQAGASRERGLVAWRRASTTIATGRRSCSWIASGSRTCSSARWK